MEFHMVFFILNLKENAVLEDSNVIDSQNSKVLSRIPTVLESDLLHIVKDIVIGFHLLFNDYSTDLSQEDTELKAIFDVLLWMSLIDIINIPHAVHHQS